jgi:tartrate-resistant acid phosphatase type 5
MRRSIIAAVAFASQWTLALAIACSTSGSGSKGARGVSSGGAAGSTVVAGSSGAAGQNGAGGAGNAAGTGASGGATTGGGSSGAGAVDASGGSGTTGSGGVDATAGAGGSSGSGPTAAVRFVALGDTGKGTADQTRVGQAIAAKCARDGCDFVQLLGDNIYESGVTSVDDPQWQQKFEQPYAAVNVPFWVVLGNHDYGGAGLGFEPARAQAQVAYSAKSSKWKLPATYYRRSVSNVEFFGLDTMVAMVNQHAQQRTEVSAWIAQSRATWKIAFGHHPYLSNGTHGNAGNYDAPVGVLLGSHGPGVKELIDAAVCSRADFYISGHDHSLQWLSATCSGTELIVSGTGASPTSLPGVNPAHYQSVKLGFLYAVISGNTFTGSFIDVDGKVEFTRTVSKTP